LAEAVKQRCTNLGLQAEISSDALHASMAISRNPPSLIIIDVQMPAEDGLSLSEKLTSNERLSSTPIIVLTGKSDEATIRRCEMVGAHYVQKGANMWPQLQPLIMSHLEPSAPPASPPSNQCVGSESARVLVIDDDPAIAQALEIRLKPLGLEVITAFNGMQGYWKAIKERPSAIIMDYTMPEGQGNYVVSRLQQHSLTQNIPIIVLTGRKNDHSIRRAMLNLGVASFLTKPLDFEALVTALHEHLPLADIG
jgi:DNA-binding response OmpR family regulator